MTLFYVRFKKNQLQEKTLYRFSTHAKALSKRRISHLNLAIFSKQTEFVLKTPEEKHDMNDLNGLQINTN